MQNPKLIAYVTANLYFLLAQYKLPLALFLIYNLLILGGSSSLNLLSRNIVWFMLFSGMYWLICHYFTRKRFGRVMPIKTKATPKNNLLRFGGTGFFLIIAAFIAALFGSDYPLVPIVAVGIFTVVWFFSKARQFWWHNLVLANGLALVGFFPLEFLMLGMTREVAYLALVNIGSFVAVGLSTVTDHVIARRVLISNEVLKSELSPSADGFTTLQVTILAALWYCKSADKQYLELLTKVSSFELSKALAGLEQKFMVVNIDEYSVFNFMGYKAIEITERGRNWLKGYNAPAKSGLKIPPTSL